MGPLYWFLKKLNPEDSHLSLATQEYNYTINDKKMLYTSNYYFKKQGEDFIVTKAPEQKLINTVFTGNKEDIKRIVENNQEVYIFAPGFNSYTEKEAKLFLNKKAYKVPIQLQDYTVKKQKVIDINETQNSLFIKCGTFHINQGSEEEKEFINALESIQTKAFNKKYIILDLRNNSGGFLFYPAELIAAIYGLRQDALEKQEFFEFLNTSAHGRAYLESELIYKQKYESTVQENLPLDVVEEYKQLYEDFKNSGKQRSIVKSSAEPTVLPQFKKKHSAKIIVLTDYITASASEYCIGYLYMVDKNNVTLVGYNTSGCLAGGDIITFTLPNSKIKINFCAISNKKP